MKRLAYNIHQIVNKLYSTIPLVPSGNLIQNIIQDIQYGLYDNCGSPEKNWNKWEERCIELLQQRNILSKSTTKVLKMAYHDVNDRDCAIVYIDGNFYESETHNEALTLYTNENNIRRTNNPSSYSREVLEDEFYNNRQLQDKQFACLNKVLYDPIEKIDVKRIFIDKDTLTNLTLNQLISSIQSKYSGFEIYLDNMNSCAHDMDSYEKVAKIANSNKEYSWQEVCEITKNAGGKSYSLPFGDYSNCHFKLEYVDVSSITGYMTYEEYREYDLDEDMGVVEYLTGQYDGGEDFPPVILDNDYKIIDGSHRVSMYENLGVYKIKAFVLYEEE